MHLSFLLAHGPQLFTNIIAWVGAALAFVAALMTIRASRNGRSMLVVASLAQTARGDLMATIANVGDRFAVDVRIQVVGAVAAGCHDGVAGKTEMQIAIPMPASTRLELDLHWKDADGRSRHRTPSFDFDGFNWRRSV